MNDEVLTADSLENALATNPEIECVSAKRPKKETCGRPQKGNAHLLSRKPQRPRLLQGDRIVHDEFGAGTIIQEWGCWLSCNGCYNEIPKGTIGCKCGKGSTVIWVSGRGTYEIKFDDGLERSCHQDRFTEANGVKYPVEKRLTIGGEIAESSDTMANPTAIRFPPIFFHEHSPESLSVEYGPDSDGIGFNRKIVLGFASEGEADDFMEYLKSNGFEWPKHANFENAENGELKLVAIEFTRFVDRQRC